MKGNLTDQPLAELIREISAKSFSGTLRLEYERVQTAVYFDKGQLVYAASNLRTLRLREYLVKREVLSASAVANLNCNLSDLDLAATLSSNRMVRQKDVDALLAILVSDVLRVCLMWTQGTWDFNERARLANTVSLNIDTATLLRETAQRMPFNFVSRRWRNAGEILSRSSEISTTSNLLPAESFVLSRLDDPLKLGELLMLSGLPEPDALGVIYGLALSGLIRREYWQNAFRTEAAKANKEATARPVATTVTVSQAEHSDNWLSANVENEDLERFLQRLRKAANHYEIIELPFTAESSEIKEAYYAMARRYHPDRFHVQSGTKLHGELSSAFARVTQAYETLIDAGARAVYDQTLRRSKQFTQQNLKASDTSAAGSREDADFAPDGSDNKFGSAEYNFREGVGALQQGRISAAVKHLSIAARLEPRKARYRAHYGRALAADESTRRLAENEIQAALKLEPENVAFRIMLAELYFELKFHRRARTEVDRALAIDPKNNVAHSLLRKLEKSRKVG
jgi:curved DNA-binding protein CbpA